MTNLYKALLKVQGEIGAIAKDSKNPFFKSSYLSLNGVRDAVLPVLGKYGVVLNQPTIYLDGKSFVSTELTHAESGETLKSITEIVCSKPGDAQNFGSGMSYSRRYGLMSVLCLAAEDDDGESAMGRNVKSAPLAKEDNSIKPLEPTSPTKSVSFSKKAVAKTTVTSGDDL